MAVTTIKRETGETLVFRTEHVTVNEQETLSLQLYEADEKLNPVSKKRYFEIVDRTEEEYHTNVRKATEDGQLMHKLCTNPEWNPKQSEDENTE